MVCDAKMMFCLIGLLLCAACGGAATSPPPTPTALVLASTATPACGGDAEVYIAAVAALSADYDAYYVEADGLFKQIVAGVDLVLRTAEWQNSVLAVSTQVTAANQAVRALSPACEQLPAHSLLLQAATSYDYGVLYIERTIQVGDPDILDGAVREFKRGNLQRGEALMLLGD